VAFCELFEDTADYYRFNLIDATFTVDGLASTIDTVDDIITEASTASGFALANAPFQASPRFMSEVLQVQSIHRTLKSDMQFADLTFRQSDQPHTGKRKLFE
jgi:hypothetical protein